MNTIEAAQTVIKSYIDDAKEEKVELKFDDSSIKLVTKDFAVGSEEPRSRRFVQIATTGTKIDRHGERMSKEVMEQIMQAHKSGKIPAFSNHGIDSGPYNRYPWQGIIGKWVNAWVDPIDDTRVISEMLVNDAHPEADLLCKYIEQGMPLGASIGARALDKSTEVIDE